MAQPSHHFLIVLRSTVVLGFVARKEDKHGKHAKTCSSRVPFPICGLSVLLLFSVSMPWIIPSDLPAVISDQSTRV